VKLYNTPSGSVEDFNPTNHVKFYTCGITPYDTTHLGHAFTYFVSDVLIRFLEAQGRKVTYVQNVTDIDDDILKKAGEEGEDWRLLGDRWTRHFIDDMESLNMRPPDYFPRATEVISDIITVVQKLLDIGVAYEWAGNVYFNIDIWPDFGKLTGLARHEMLPIANQRGNHPDDPHKRDPLDFVLWQARAPGEPAWESPWGPGRPGWHIECSTMATQLLGETIDIHSGGKDLAFPHHECEIAQVEPISGKKPYVRHWLHVAMVRHEGEKMSKSLGNLVMVRDLLQDYSADAVRLYLAMHHYRDPWSYSWFELFKAKRLDRDIKLALAAESFSGKMTNPLPFAEKFNRALENDLDTPRALIVVQDLVSNILSDSQARQNVSQAQEQLQDFGNVLGLQMDGPGLSEDVSSGWSNYREKFTKSYEQQPVS
jgi:L-cysteine:1D-myo-inositol 2-amino-2-deoxy-alpha-D-glucopyranoside ligase